MCKVIRFVLSFITRTLKKVVLLECSFADMFRFQRMVIESSPETEMRATAKQDFHGVLPKITLIKRRDTHLLSLFLRQTFDPCLRQSHSQDPCKNLVGKMSPLLLVKGDTKTLLKTNSILVPRGSCHPTRRLFLETVAIET